MMIKNMAKVKNILIIELNKKVIRKKIKNMAKV